MNEATQEVSAIQHGVFTRFGGAGAVPSAVVSLPLIEDVVSDAEAPLFMLMAAVCCVLLVACLNLSNLLVARAVARSKEMAMRSALGGGRVRLICQQMTECLLICFSGGVLDVAFAAWAVRWLTTYWLNLPRAEAIHIDASVLIFAVGVTSRWILVWDTACDALHWARGRFGSAGQRQNAERDGLKGFAAERTLDNRIRTHCRTPDLRWAAV
jgi:hypothetical protein